MRNCTGAVLLSLGFSMTLRCIKNGLVFPSWLRHEWGGIWDTGKSDGYPLALPLPPFPFILSRALKEISPCRFPIGPYLARHRTTCGRQSSEQTSNVITWLPLQWWWVFFLPRFVALYHSPSLVLYPSRSTFSFPGNRHFQDEHGNCKNKTQMVRAWRRQALYHHPLVLGGLTPLPSRDLLYCVLVLSLFKHG